MTERTAVRARGLGYHWHNVMHLVMGPVTEAVYETLAEKRPSTVRTTCGGWPNCRAAGRHHRNSVHADAAASSPATLSRRV